MFAGYLDNPDANAAAFRDGWFRTGDVGMLDEHGALFITGRRSDMFISGGSNIHPRDIEEKILSHPAVAEVLVLGMPDPEWGELGVAVCVAQVGATIDPEELRSYLAERMARYKVPRYILTWDELPRSAYGKVVRRTVRDQLIGAGMAPPGRDCLMTLTRWTQPLRHPGPAATVRRTSIATTSTQAYVTLPAGARLIDAMSAEIERLGCVGGLVELLDGTFSRISYCCPALSQDGTVAVTYSGMHEALAPARLVAGSATVGFRDGERFAHCHVTWFDADGRLRGGHLWPDTVIGLEPIRAVVHALSDVDMISATDAESDLPVFTPHIRSPLPRATSAFVR